MEDIKCYSVLSINQKHKPKPSVYSNNINTFLLP